MGAPTPEALAPRWFTHRVGELQACVGAVHPLGPRGPQRAGLPLAPGDAASPAVAYAAGAGHPLLWVLTPAALYAAPAASGAAAASALAAPPNGAGQRSAWRRVPYADIEKVGMVPGPKPHQGVLLGLAGGEQLAVPVLGGAPGSADAYPLHDFLRHAAFWARRDPSPPRLGPPDTGVA